MKSKIDSNYIKHDEKRICQGDILRDFKYSYQAINNKGEEVLSIIPMPYLIILTQDCDLDRDFEHRNGSENNDKFIDSILVCPAYLSEKLKDGTHLESHDYKMQNIGKESKTYWNKIELNEIQRYHCLKEESHLQIPKLVVDFKHYYTIQRDFLYRNFSKHYLGTLNELFREDLSQRFANYLSRIGLPVIQK